MVTIDQNFLLNEWPNLKKSPILDLHYIEFTPSDISFNDSWQKLGLGFFDLRLLKQFTKEGSIISKWKPPINKIDAQAFTGFSHLTCIDLSNNPLRQIDANLFEGLFNLEQINLANCYLAEIDTKMFRGLSKLVNLYLDRNKLTDLDPSVFEGLENLEVIYLHRNRIYKLDIKGFRSLRKIKIISLFDNSARFKSFASKRTPISYDSLSDQTQKDFISSIKQHCVSDFEEFLNQGQCFDNIKL